MPFAAMTTFDYFVVAVVLLSLLIRRPAAGLTHADRKRLRQVEDKLDLILGSLGLEYEPAPDAAWKAAADAGETIEAIRCYREQTGVGLKEAKETVDAYIGTKRR